jgi:hypothetical protein
MWAGDECGQEMNVGRIIKWGTHYLGFVLGGAVGYLLLCWVLPFQLDETVTHIGWMWGHEGDGM